MVNIQWYPGHMDKARRDMQKNLKAVDLIVEVRDARIPLASANPILDQMANGKPRLIILSKADLADPKETEKWIQYFTKEDQMALALDLVNDKTSRNKAIQACNALCEPKKQRMIARGIKPRAMRAMACGIPNAGKSTFINRIAKKTIAKTADKPGVTRSLAWIKADKTLDLMDTPGVLWPKFEDQNVGLLLAETGAINGNIIDTIEVSIDAISRIQDLYKGLLETEFDVQGDARAVLEGIARKRNLLKGNEELDVLRAANMFLSEFRKGKYGLISLEQVDQIKSEDDE